MQRRHFLRLLGGGAGAAVAVAAGVKLPPLPPKPAAIGPLMTIPLDTINESARWMERLHREFARALFYDAAGQVTPQTFTGLRPRLEELQ